MIYIVIGFVLVIRAVGQIIMPFMILSRRLLRAKFSLCYWLLVKYDLPHNLLSAKNDLYEELTEISKVIIQWMCFWFCHAGILRVRLCKYVRVTHISHVMSHQKAQISNLCT